MKAGCDAGLTPARRRPIVDYGSLRCFDSCKSPCTTASPDRKSAARIIIVCLSLSRSSLELVDDCHYNTIEMFRLGPSREACPYEERIIFLLNSVDAISALPEMEFCLLDVEMLKRRYLCTS